MSSYECDDCGLCDTDLPADLAFDHIFERGDDGAMRCQGCDMRRENRR